VTGREIWTLLWARLRFSASGLVARLLQVGGFGLGVRCPIGERLEAREPNIEPECLQARHRTITR
jgi:hypothetical protein